MLCNKCNSQIPDDSEFCPVCGEKVVPILEEDPTPITTSTEPDSIPITTAAEPEVEEEKAPEDASIQEPAKDETKNNAKKTNPFDIIGIIGGIVCILAGCIMLIAAVNDLNPASFGADFYTYTYDGIYKAAELLSIIAKGISGGLIGIGAAISCFFASHLTEKK